MIRWQRNQTGASAVYALRALLLMSIVFGVMPVFARPARADDVNFNEHIGPIIHKHCSSCHRDGGVGPFELIEYRDVAVRAEQILEVVGSGYMPPWLPESQEHEFDGVRRLSAEEKDLLKRWNEAATPEGDGELTLPIYSSKWLLGEPDVELAIKDPFLMPAEGPDVFRNFVLPPNLDRTRYVTAFDFRPEPVAPIHHAVLRLDHTGRSRTLESEDPLPGFGGMENGRLTFGGFSRDPGGRLLGWLPGKIPSHEPQTAWVIHPDDDIVFQLHLQAQGKPEKVKGTVALYLSDTPPPLPTYTVFLSARDIDIPAGEESYAVSRSYTLPVDVDVHGIYPHAHFICKSMHVVAQIPGGEKIQLIKISDWDFYWQDDYKYAQPFRLPAGTTLQMDYVFDNSAENVRNPYSPPRRIAWGEKSNDEMADLGVLVVPTKASDLGVLQQHFVQSKLTDKLAEYRKSLESDPENLQLMTWIGEVEVMLGNPAAAVKQFDMVMRQTPKDARLVIKNALAHQALGDKEREATLFATAAKLAPDDIDIQNAYAEYLARTGKLREAVGIYKSLVQKNPANHDAIMGLAQIARSTGNPGKAIEFATRATEVRSNSSSTWEFLGRVLMAKRKYPQAEGAFRKSLKFDARNVGAWLALGDMQLMDRRPLAARETFKELVKIVPDSLIALNKLAVIAAMRSEWEASEEYLEAALKVNKEDQMTLANLGRTLRNQNKVSEALEVYAKAVAAKNVSPVTASQYAWLLAARNDASPAEIQSALQWASYATEKAKQPNADLLDTLAVAQAASGQFDEALKSASRAVELVKEANPRKALEMMARRDLYRNKNRFVDSTIGKSKKAASP